MLASKKLKKSGQNKFAGYSYFELGDFVPAALEIFKEIGLCSHISFSADFATLTIVNTDKPDEHIVISSPMAVASLKGCHDIQNLGAVQTYLRRYLWVAALEICENDILDMGEEKKAAPIIKPMPAAKDLDITQERQAELDIVASRIVDFVTGGTHGDALLEIEYIAEKNQDEKIYLWGKLPSAIRTALKKAKAENVSK